MAELVVYPSLDGYVDCSNLGGVDWSNLHDGLEGLSAFDATVTLSLVVISSKNIINKWKTLGKGIILFDISAYPITALSAILSIYGAYKEDALGIASDINVYSSNPDSNVALVGTDFKTLGTTPYCDTPITYPNFDDGGWNNFILNPAGLAALAAAIAGDGIFKLGLRNAEYDAADIEPPWASGKDFLLYGYATEKGVGFKPKLTITYIAVPTVTTNPATAISHVSATLNGLLDDDGGEACECGFEWGLDTGYGLTTPTDSKVTGQSFSQAIGGLFPGTTYHFRAFATNSVGTGYGVDRSFTTTPGFNRAHALSREEL